MPTFSERWLSVVQGVGLDLSKPINIVSTEDIAKFGGRETRMMVSIDTESKQPDIFKKHGVFATPLSRTKVAIVRGKGFERIGEFGKPATIHKTDFAFPEYLKKSHGEANFLKYAYNCGLLSHFTKRPTLRPEYSAKARAYFTFRVDGHKPLNVEGAQYELDESYGDESLLYLVESKFTTPKSFNIRQLYYPFRVFAPEVKPREVKNLLFTYEPEEGEYRFWEYTFTDPDDYESISLVRNERFSVEFSKSPIPLRRYEVQPVKMEAIQANNVFFLLDVPFAVADGIDDTHKLANHLGVVNRQGIYYRDAMEILGFLTRHGHHSRLTSVGEEYLNTPVEERTRFFIKRLAEYPPVAEIIKRILSGEKIDSVKRTEIIERIYLNEVSKSTIPRRADCLRKFFEFIADVMGYCKVENGVISLANARETLNGYR